MAQSEQHPDASDRRQAGSSRKTDASTPFEVLSDVDLDSRIPHRDATPARPRLDVAIDLPEQPTALIGREELLAASVRWLDHPATRLVTLIGSGGVGKTRLACAIAQQAASHYELLRFIDLAPLREDLVATAITDSLGLERRAGGLQLNLWRNRRTLLVLDNFEHVLDAAPQVAEILSISRNIDMIVTSREPLRLRWERVISVPPLDLPEGGERLSIVDMAKIPSIALFTLHVQRFHPDFELTEANAETVAEICRYLNGLPLALELAASQLQVRTLGRLRDQLEQRLDVLDHGPRDLPPRQRSMRAAIGWSYRMLSPLEQLVARRSAIFAGGGSVEAAEAVIKAPAEAESVYDVFVALAEKSILTLDVTREASPRFTILNITREYLLERLASDDERAAIETRFADYCLRLAERHGRSADASGLQTLDREIENFRSVLQASIAHRNPAIGLQLALGLTWYWTRTGQIDEARRWLEQLAVPGNLPEFAELRIEALAWAGRLALYQGDLKAATSRLEDALKLAERGGSMEQRVAALFDLAHVHVARGDTLAAEALVAGAFPRVGGDIDDLKDAAIRYARGSIAAAHGRGDEARSLLSSARALFKTADADDQVVQVTLTLADLNLVEGAAEPAKHLYVDAIERARRARDWRLEARGQIGLGIVAHQQQDEESSLGRLKAAFEIADSYGDEVGVALAIDALALLGESSSRLVPEWLQLAGYADATLDHLGMAPTTLERKRTQAIRQAARDILGVAEFERLGAEGRQLSREQVRAMLEMAHAGGIEEIDAEQDVAGLDRLTRREREVAQNIARGLTNRQIALELNIAERTVDTHVGNVLRKLGLPSRAMVAVWAVEHGLVSL